MIGINTNCNIPNIALKFNFIGIPDVIKIINGIHVASCGGLLMTKLPVYTDKNAVEQYMTMLYTDKNAVQRYKPLHILESK